MGVTFLSDDWASEVNAALASHEGFQSAISDMDLSMQFHVTDAPDPSQIDYYVQIADGRAMVQRGELPEPDLSVTNTYETAAAISKGELNTQQAFISGRLKVKGNLAKLMLHQAALQQFANAVSDIEIDY